MRHAAKSVWMLLGAAGFMAACASEPTDPGGTSTVIDKPSSTAPIVLAPPPDGYQLTFGPFAVPSGDVQLCRTLKLDNEKEIALNRFDLKMLPGSHHFILFRAQKKADGTYIEYPDQVFDCKGTINFDEWDFMFDVNQVGGTDYQLADGQAVLLPPHAQLLMQAHFLNASAVKAPQGGYDVLNMYKTDPAKVLHPIRGKFTVNTNVAIPPKSTDWTTYRRCSFSRSVHITSMTGHSHNQGRTFRVMFQNMFDNSIIDEAYCSGSDCSDEAGRASNWDHPLFKYFSPAFIVNGGINADIQGLNFSCSYDNPLDRYIYFGGLAETQEHCNLFFQYYYDVEDNNPLTCAEGSGGW